MSATSRSRLVSLRRLAPSPSARRWVSGVEVGFDRMLIVAGAAALLILIVAGGSGGLLGIFRAVLAVAFILFVPGYCLIAALFPREDDLEAAERVALSIGSSIVAVAFVAIFLDRLGLGLRMWPILLTQYALCAAFAALSLRRRASRGDDGARSAPRTGPPWRGFGQHRGSLLISVAVGVVGVTMLTPTPEPLTEFYVLSEDGRAEGYPYQADSDQPITVVVGVVNEEGSAAEYRVFVSVRDADTAEGAGTAYSSDAFTLGDGQLRELSVSWRMPTPGAEQPVDILLFRDDGQLPYRQLRMWIDVSAEI